MGLHAWEENNEARDGVMEALFSSGTRYPKMIIRAEAKPLTHQAEGCFFRARNPEDEEYRLYLAGIPDIGKAARIRSLDRLRQGAVAGTIR